MSFFSGKKIFLLGFIVILLVAVPLTVFLTQQRQQTTSSAAPATTISFVPSTQAKNVGDVFAFDIFMDPGTNQVSFVKMTINYDATKLATDTAGLVPNSANFAPPLEGPTYSSGAISVTLSVGADPTRVIQTRTKIATLNLKATAPGNAQVSLPRASLQVLSIASADQASENVLASDPAPATITIGGTAATPTPTVSTNKAPVCSSLVLDRSSSGVAPYSLTFTATGSDADGTINKVTFAFGDGQQTDVTQGAGIGTNSVNAQIAHKYANAGTFSATATLTDNQNLTSAVCTTAITVTTSAGTGGSSGSSGGAGTTVAPTAVATVAPTAPLAPTGPGDKILGVGVAGIVFTILGGLLFLAL